ncbi:MAG TPA: hypothetical protein VFC18_17905 [Burkholderiales bacterium]|nr:hypothetical protein [Burkholderiales bacterium]
MATIHKPFKYVPAHHTDIRVTFKREFARLRAMQEKKPALEEQPCAATVSVMPIAQSKVRSA